MKKIFYLLLLLLLPNCSIEKESDLYELKQLTKYETTIITEHDEIVNKLRLNELDYIYLDAIYDKIVDIKSHKNSIKETWIDKEIKNDNVDYNFYINELINNYFDFTIKLDFIKYDDESTYYKSYDGWCNINTQYKWNINGFSIYTSKTKNVYDFKITTYLYFKVLNENEIYYIQIPMYINGTINIVDESITFDIDV